MPLGKATWLFTVQIQTSQFGKVILREEVTDLFAVEKYLLRLPVEDPL